MNLVDEKGRPIQKVARDVKHIQQQKTNSLPAGQAEFDYYTVPAAKSWFFLIADRDCTAPPGATAGSHGFCWNIHGTYTNIHRYDAGFTFNQNISNNFKDLSLFAAGAGKQFSIEYRNGTDVAQTNARKSHVIYIEEDA